MFKYIISYDGGQLRDSGDFEWGLFNSYGEAEEEANNAKEEYMNDWDIEGSEYDPDDFCIEIVEVQIMKRTPKVIKQQTEEWLDERWMIANMKDARLQDMSYYNGALKALEFAGYEWKRDAYGKHTLFKQIGVMEMNSAELAKRIFDCLSDGYDDEEYREQTEMELYNELSQISDGSIKVAFIRLCERIEELEAQ